MTNEAAVRTGSPKRCIHANIKHYFKQNKMSYSRFEEIQETPPHILAIRFCGRVQFPAYVLAWARRKQEKANDQMEAEKRKQLRIERKAQLAEEILWKTGKVQGSGKGHDD